MPNPADTLTLQDLRTWDRRDAAGNFLPSLAVLGHPVAHSVSPQMHNAALAELAKKHPQLKNWRYFKFEIKPEELEEALDLLHQKNFQGVNLTVPHKVAGIALVTASADALRIGAINTLEKTPAGGWKAYNTDTYGFFTSLKRELNMDLGGATIVLLGAGGAARAAATQCLDAGCAKIWIGNENEPRRRALIKDLNAPDRVDGFFLPAPNANQWPPDVLVINATPVGLKVEDQEPGKVQQHLGPRARIFDMTFLKGDTTRFVTTARNHGLRATDGLGMLIWQGAKSLTIWIKAHEGIDIQPESIAQTMMDAATQALGQPPRHV